MSCKEVDIARGIHVTVKNNMSVARCALITLYTSMNLDRVYPVWFWVNLRLGDIFATTFTQRRLADMTSLRGIRFVNEEYEDTGVSHALHESAIGCRDTSLFVGNFGVSTPVSDSNNEIFCFTILLTEIIHPIHFNPLQINKSLQLEVAEAWIAIIVSCCPVVHALCLGIIVIIMR